MPDLVATEGGAIEDTLEFLESMRSDLQAARAEQATWRTYQARQGADSAGSVIEVVGGATFIRWNDDRLECCVSFGTFRSAHAAIDLVLDEVGDSTLLREMLFSQNSSARLRLDDRDRQIISMAAHGTPTKLISRQLGLAESTVKNRLNRIYQRTGVHNRNELIMKAIAMRVLVGYGPEDPPRAA